MSLDFQCKFCFEGHLSSTPAFISMVYRVHLHRSRHEHSEVYEVDRGLLGDCCHGENFLSSQVRIAVLVGLHVHVHQHQTMLHCPKQVWFNFIYLLFIAQAKTRVSRTTKSYKVVISGLTSISHSWIWFIIRRILSKKNMQTTQRFSQRKKRRSNQTKRS